MKRLFGICTLLISMAFSQGVVTQLDKGSVNYSDQSISAIGIGFIPVNGSLFNWNQSTLHNLVLTMLVKE